MSAMLLCHKNVKLLTFVRYLHSAYTSFFCVHFSIVLLKLSSFKLLKSLESPLWTFSKCLSSSTFWYPFFLSLSQFCSGHKVHHRGNQIQRAKSFFFCLQQRKILKCLNIFIFTQFSARLKSHNKSNKKKPGKTEKIEPLHFHHHREISLSFSPIRTCHNINEAFCSDST